MIIVAKDKKAEELLDYDEARDEDLIILELGDSDFRGLFEAGFFDAINDAASVIIDDYEHEWISDAMALDRVARVVAQRLPEFVEIYPVVNNILELFREAISRGTSINFFF
jgi:hypothetical protein